MNKENEFIHQFGINRGFQTSTQKVDRCLFLSSDAKQLYRNICHYAYGDRRGCFPGQATLRLELGWSRGLMSKILKELIDLGFIATSSRGANKTLCYHIKELNLVPILYHSEIVHGLKPANSVEVEAFSALLDEYKSSELYAKVNSSGVPNQFSDEIKAWFSERMSDSSELEEDKSPDEPTEHKTLRRIEPKIAPTVDKVLDSNSKPKGGGSGHYSKKDVEVWNYKDFCEYFKDKYNENHKSTYMGNMNEDRIFMKNVVDKRGKDITKELIDLYILNTDYSLKLVKHFSNSNVQQNLGVLRDTGKMHEFHRENKSVPKPTSEDFDPEFGF